MSAPFDRRRLVFLSLLSGLCSLLPIPFVDDWLRNKVRRRTVREMAAHHGVMLQPLDVRWMTSGPPWSASGCAQGCVNGAFAKAVAYVLKKLLRSVFRKIVYVLAVKDASDTFSISVHRGWMIDRALAIGHLGRDEDPPRVWQAMQQIQGETDPRPFEASVRAVLRGSRTSVKRGVHILRRALRRGQGDEERLDDETLQDEANVLDDLVSDLESELDASSGYFEQLAARYVDAYVRLHAEAAARTEGDTEEPNV